MRNLRAARHAVLRAVPSWRELRGDVRRYLPRYLRTLTPSSIVPYIVMLPEPAPGELAPPCAQAAHDSTAMTAQAARMTFIGLCFPDKTRFRF